MTWFNLVKSMKKRKKFKDPYKAARKYLPPNSTINCPFERPDEKKPKKKRKKLKYDGYVNK
jgi:hypothetical protein